MADNTAYQDLLKDTSESKEDGNYFLVTITDLIPNKTYPIQFRWLYKDKKINDNWSAVKLITTPGESEPNTPRFTSSNVDVSSPEKIIITWDGTSDDTGNPAIINYDRVDVYIDGLPFDGTKAAYSFKAPGTTTISAPAGTYQIVLYAISKTGVKSPVSSAVTKTVVASGVPVQTPTLPSNITVATAPFAVTVNWDGTYSSSTFTGFKSIDIYAVGSDLGSSATSGITSTNLVGSLTVNNTANKINISLDNLRQALGLSTNSDVYNASIFYYYNATNTNNTKYGSPTYTRINSSSVIPTKANYVDLASGVISIENLVAGNGQFSSWLRTGSAGGARIELSSVSDFTNNGYTVQKGLVAYSSGSTELFNLDLDSGSLTINGSGTFTGDLTAGSGNSIFKSDSSGIYLGNASYASAPFSVSRNGIIKAVSGTIGGWTLGSTYLQGSNLKLDTSGITVGDTSSSYFDISPSSLTHRNSNGTASGKFTLTLGASPQLTLDGTLTVGGSSVATSVDLAGKVSNGQVSADSSFTANNIVYKINGNSNTTTIDGGKITTGTVVAGSVVAGWVYAGNISANQINAGTLSANYLSGGTITGIEFNNGSGTFKVTSGGSLTATDGTIAGWVLNNTSGGYLANSNADTFLYSNPGSDGVAFSTIGRGIMRRLQLNGSLGTTLGSATLAVGGSATFDSSIFTSGKVDVAGGTTILNSSGTIYANTLGTGSGLNIVQVQSGTNTGFLKVSTSSRRFKENIVEINTSGYLNLIDDIKPVMFNYIEQPNADPIAGLIAEDLAEIPLMKNFVVNDSEDIPLGINYDRITVALIMALKEIKIKLENIEQRLDALEA